MAITVPKHATENATKPMHLYVITHRLATPPKGKPAPETLVAGISFL
jgi:hypothetical protein